MIDIKEWMEVFCGKLNSEFGDRIDFIGLQGSYGRSEATEISDIDVVVIFDKLLPEDIEKYNNMLDTLPHRELICGFVSGKNELVNWDSADLFQFYYDTTPIKGDLSCLLPLIDSKSVKRAVHMGACNIYHMCVHNMLHEKDMEILRGLYKSAVFTMQAMYYMETGKYIKRKDELIEVLREDERGIVMSAVNFNISTYNFKQLSERLFIWSRNLINKAAVM